MHYAITHRQISHLASAICSLPLRLQPSDIAAVPTEWGMVRLENNLVLTLGSALSISLDEPMSSWLRQVYLEEPDASNG